MPVLRAGHLGKLQLAHTSLRVFFKQREKSFDEQEWIQFFCNFLFNYPKVFTCLSGKLRTEFTSPIANYTSPQANWTGLSLSQGRGGCTWVYVCWVCSTDLSEPLPHYSLFFGQLQTPSQSLFGKCNFRNPSFVTFYLYIYLINVASSSGM